MQGHLPEQHSGLARSPRFGESAGDATPPQLGDRRRGAGRAGGDFGWPGKLPDAVGPQMPKGIVPGPFGAGTIPFGI